ncbi:MAG: YHS domain-containing protein [Chloroflexi bacterium]|nr:YHS domain-containing protein [Chloroflexota bacterium]
MQPNNNSSTPSIIDPVCGMKVDANQPPYCLIYQGKEVFFCSDVCKRLFEREPGKYVKPSEY